MAIQFKDSEGYDIQVIFTIDDDRQAAVRNKKNLHQAIQVFVRENRRFYERVKRVEVLKRGSEPYDLPVSVFKVYAEAKL